MTCPYCEGKTKVVDTVCDVDCVYRERKCVTCGYRFLTTETESKTDYAAYMGSLRYKQRKEGRG